MFHQDFLLLTYDSLRFADDFRLLFTNGAVSHPESFFKCSPMGWSNLYVPHQCLLLCLTEGIFNLQLALHACLCALQRCVYPGLQRLELSGCNSVAINPCTVGRVQTLQQLRLFRVFGANALHLRCMTARQDGLRACWGRRLVMLCTTVWFQSVPVAMPVTNLVDGEAIHGCDF